jgi:hypothetical protein
MAGRTNALTISSTQRGPAYSVADRAGRTLLSTGTLDDLRRVDPLLYRHLKQGIATATAEHVENDAADPWAGVLLAR